MSAAELIAAVSDLLPLQVDFGSAEAPNRWLRIEPTSDIAFVPRVGLRMTCSGTLHYPLPILPDEYIIKLGRVVVRPSIAQRDDGPVMLFDLGLEALDIRLVPEFLDDHILEKVNERLRLQASRIAWPFTRTLTRTFGLGQRLTLADHVAFATRGGALEVTDDGLVLTVYTDVSFPRAPSVAVTAPAPLAQ